MINKELDIISFIETIRKFETFYEECGHKWIPKHIKSRSIYKVVNSSDEDAD